jgi:hypothetical protein
MAGIFRKSIVLMLLMLPQSYPQAQERSLYETQQPHRCNRDTIPATTPSSRYQLHNDGTVTDLAAGLMWRSCVEGLKGKNCDKGKALELSWAGAMTYVPKLNSEGGFAGYKDWRLPNIRELGSLIEFQCVSPAINLEIFPNTSPVHFWSSSGYHFYTHYSWFVDFSIGQITNGERILPKQLRLVRGGN